MEQTVANLQAAAQQLQAQLADSQGRIGEQTTVLQRQGDALYRVQKQRADELERVVKLQDQLSDYRSKTQFVDVKGIG